MYVIAGVTGHTGKIVADTLLAKGQKVRVLVRSAAQGAPWAARGAEVAVASLDDEAALTKALTGAQGAYLLLPPDMGATDYLAGKRAQVDVLTHAIEKSGVGHVVLLSSIAAHVEKKNGPIAALHLAERSLEKTGRAVTFVRAAYFLENFGAVLPAAKADGVLPSFLPASFTHPVVATADIGRACAQALLDGPRGRRVIELAGPVDASANDVAKALTGLLGREIKVAEAPLAAVVPAFTSMGVGANMAELYRELYAGMIDGVVAFEGKGETQRGTVGLAEGLRGLLG